MGALGFSGENAQSCTPDHMVLLTGNEYSCHSRQSSVFPLSEGAINPRLVDIIGGYQIFVVCWQRPNLPKYYSSLSLTEKLRIFC